MGNVAETMFKIACPNCRKGDELYELATVEQMTPIEGFVDLSPDDEPALEPVFSGASETLYENSKTLGVHCRGCDWSHEGDDWERYIQPPPIGSTITLTEDQQEDPDPMPAGSTGVVIEEPTDIAFLNDGEPQWQLTVRWQNQQRSLAALWPADKMTVAFPDPDAPIDLYPVD